MEQIPYSYLRYIMDTIDELKNRSFKSLKAVGEYITTNGGYILHEEENFLDFGYNNIEATFYKEGNDIVIHGLIEAWDDVGDKMLEILI